MGRGGVGWVLRCHSDACAVLQCANIVQASRSGLASHSCCHFLFLLQLKVVSVLLWVSLKGCLYNNRLLHLSRLDLLLESCFSNLTEFGLAAVS